MIARRAFLRASLAVACAPIIVRAASLMKVRQRVVTIGYDITRVPVAQDDLVMVVETWVRCEGGATVTRFIGNPAEREQGTIVETIHSPIWPFAYEGEDPSFVTVGRLERKAGRIFPLPPLKIEGEPYDEWGGLA